MLRTRCARVGVLLAAAAFVPSVVAQTLPTGFTTAVVAPGITGPTCLAVDADGSFYACQQNGVLKRWNASTGAVSTVTTFTVVSGGETGLIGLALDPAFARTRYLYVYATLAVPSTTQRRNTILRVTLDDSGEAVVEGSRVTLFEIDGNPGGIHNGGAMHFGPDGMLYVAVGEYGMGSNSQSLGTLKGKMLRLNVGNWPGDIVPTDNPTSFPGIAGETKGINRAIWAAGLRNPYTFAFQPGTGRMFINDVGAGTAEEVNDGLAGRNYGWPATEGRFTQASFPNFMHPLISIHRQTSGQNYPTGIGAVTSGVVIGGVFYSMAASNPAAPTGSRPNFPISYKDQYFFADFSRGFMRTFDPPPAGTNTGAAFGSGTGFSQITGMVLAPDGTILYTTRQANAVYRIRYTLANGVCCRPDGTCVLWNQGFGDASGSATSTEPTCPGTFIWGDAVCGSSTCVIAAPTGACCDGSICVVTTAAECGGAGRRFAGANVACNAPLDASVASTARTPCCLADFDQSGTGGAGNSVSIDDIFVFLNAWFAGDIRTDIDRAAGVNIDDIFIFLNAWFQGC